MGSIAADNVLKEVICDYFVNRDLSDGELSESDTDSNDDDESAKFRKFVYLKFLSCHNRPKKPILR